jgi:NAD-dependent SIR2 family protein deacetylase
LNDILEGLKGKKFKKVVLLTGAGLSVGAGIPDFRSPGTGLYSKLAKFNLPYPEAIFTLKYFKEKPEAFYSLAK